MKQLFTSLFFVYILWACQKDSNSTTPTPTPITDGSESIHLLLGNPSGAINYSAKTTNYLLIKPQYVASYNSQTGIPNWTAWHLGKSDLGSAKRQDDFRPDASLPTEFYQVKPTDYTSMDGFDRGHMCPSADRVSTIEDNSATFLMTNIVPQAPELNRGIWEEFEAFCREQLYNGNELYIISGSYGIGGGGSNGRIATMAGGKITVPARYYKLVLILPEGDNDLARINENTTVLAIDVPNSKTTADKNWEDYITTVTTIEQNARLNFWSVLAENPKTKLKSKKYVVTITTPPTSSTTTTPTTGTATTPGTTTTTTPSTSTTTTPSTNCGYHNGKKLYKGPEGGCYYINSNGNKTYVSRSECTC